MLIGYARTSTLDQQASVEAQVRDLLAAGCEKVFQEQVSSVDVAARDQLAEALDYCRDGDTLVVTKLDRLARSTAHLLEVVQALQGKGTALRVQDMSLDTGTANGRMMLTILGAIAQFEREVMLERQREGIEKARRKGKYNGRKPTARAQAHHVSKLHSEGVGATEIARRLEIGRASVYRILKDRDGQES